MAVESYAPVVRWSNVAAAAIAMLGCGGNPKPTTSATEAHLAAAESHEARRQYQLAEREYRLAIRSARTNAEEHRARRELVDALIFWGELSAAATELELMTTSASADPRAWHDLGIVRANLGDVAGSEAALVRAAELAPDDPRPKIALAALWLRNGSITKARQIYVELRSMSLPPDLHRAVEQAIRVIDGKGNGAP